MPHIRRLRKCIQKRKKSADPDSPVPRKKEGGPSSCDGKKSILSLCSSGLTLSVSLFKAAMWLASPVGKKRLVRKMS